MKKYGLAWVFSIMVLSCFSQEVKLRHVQGMVDLPEWTIAGKGRYVLPGIGAGPNRLPISPKLFPDGYSYQPVAVFCRLEWRMERVSGLPLRFRLGTLEYVDRLERKHVWIRPDGTGH